MVNFRLEAGEGFDYGLEVWEPSRGARTMDFLEVRMTAKSSPSTRPATMRLAVPCELSAVRAAAEAVHEFLATRGCSEEEVTACELALVEACNNAIQYARPGERKVPVVIDTSCCVEKIEIRVTDRTAGFDWPAEVSLPEFGSERGRGLFLIRKMMDSAQYLRGGQTNTLVLRKRRKGAKTE
jgi:anti-sigma regulatory factor (Ser/Thr protein kinase)